MCDKLYQICGASYDGCNGWTEWNTGMIYKDKKKAEDKASEMTIKSAFNRYSAEEVIIMDCKTTKHKKNKHKKPIKEEDLKPRFEDIYDFAP